MRFNTNKKFVAASAAAFIAFAPAMAQDAGVAPEKPVEPPAVSKFTTKSGSTMEIHYLLQTQAYSAESAYVADKDSTYSTDFKIRRNRFIFMGDVMKNIAYFVETDDLNIGSSGNSNAANKTFVQDAYIDFTIADELKIASGMILLPFAHHSRTSAIRLLGLDYNVDAVKLAATNVWRDTGIEARGLLFNTFTGKKGLLDYRAGVFQGVDKSLDTDTATAGVQNSNTGDSPRFTGRLMLNFLDSEKTFYYSNNPLKNMHQFSIGGGVDYQHNGMWNDNNKPADAMSWVTDLVVNQAVGENHLTMHAAYFQYKNYTYTGTTMFAELGFLVRSINLQPVVKYIEDNANNSAAKQYISGGLNYFFMEHNANIKTEYKYGINKADQSLFTIQAQTFI